LINRLGEFGMDSDILTGSSQMLKSLRAPIDPKTLEP